MTPKQEYYRRALLAKIHCHPYCKERKEMEVWEDFLLNCYAVKSSAELSIDELFNLLNVINGKAEPKISGIRPRKKTKKATDKTKPYIRNEPLTEKQEACIRTMFSLTPDERGMCFIEGELRKFVIKQTSEPVMYVHNLTVEQANKIITGKQYILGIKQHKKKAKKQ
jgi:hypothetical protein